MKLTASAQIKKCLKFRMRYGCSFVLHSLKSCWLRLSLNDRFLQNKMCFSTNEYRALFVFLTHGVKCKRCHPRTVQFSILITCKSKTQSVSYKQYMTIALRRDLISHICHINPQKSLHDNHAIRLFIDTSEKKNTFWHRHVSNKRFFQMYLSLTSFF